MKQAENGYNLPYDKLNSELKTIFKKQFNIVYKKLSYQIQYSEMCILYNLLNNIKNKDTDLAWERNFKTYLKIDHETV